MKKTLALMAGCALCVSAATAAVQGNNTAVIISKPQATTDEGFQFLCVPVRGFDITGQARNGFVALGSFLPASTLPSGTQVFLGEDASTIYEVQNNKWTSRSSEGGYETPTGEAEPQLQVGSKLWLKTPRLKTPTMKEMLPTIYFVGEKGRTLAEGEKLIQSLADGMVAYGNDTDTAVPLSQVATAQHGDQIQRIEDGGTTYRVYRSIEGKTWLDLTDYVAADTVTIAPGEAFYYYRAQSAE